MLTKEDIQRLNKMSEGFSNFGSHIGHGAIKSTNFIIGKTILLAGIIVCAIVFTLFGIFNRKINHA
jgi:hypothetical protein